MRTIVGSWPHRRALPEGREALERALAHVKGWCRHNLDTAEDASERAFWFANGEDGLSRCAEWLPERYRSMSVTALREELRKLDEAAP